MCTGFLGIARYGRSECCQLSVRVTEEISLAVSTQVWICKSTTLYDFIENGLAGVALISFTISDTIPLMMPKIGNLV